MMKYVSSTGPYQWSSGPTSFPSRDDQVFDSSPGSIQHAPSSRFDPQRSLVMTRAIGTFVTARSAGIRGTLASGTTMGLGLSLFIARLEQSALGAVKRCAGTRAAVRTRP